MKTGRPGIAPAWLGALGSVLVLMLSRLETSGAIPREEFAAAPWLFGARPVLLGISLLLLVLGVVRYARTDADVRLRVLFAAGAAIVALSFLAPAVLLSGGLALAVASAAIVLTEDARAEDGPGLEDLGRRLLGMRLRRIPEMLVFSSFLAALGGLALGMVETIVFTARFVPDLVSPESLAGLRRGLLSLAAMLGLEIGLGTTLVLILLASMLRLLARLGVPPRVLPATAAIAAGQGMGVVIVLLLRSCVADEIDELQLTGAVVLLGVLLGGAFAVPAHDRLRRWKLRGLGGRVPGDLPGYVAAIAGTALLPPRRVIGGRLDARIPNSSRLRDGLLAASSAFALGLLAVFLYPTLEDFRGQLFDFIAGLGVLLVATLLLVVVRTRGEGRRPGLVAAAAAVVLAGAIAVGSPALGRAEVRLVAHEYSRLGAFTARFTPALLVHAFPRIGEAPVPGVVFEHHREEETSLPALPLPLERLAARPPILLFIWDAARPDHTTLFGYEHSTTPNLVEFAKDAVVFRNAYSVGTATSHGVRCFMTGRYATRYMLSKTHPPFFTHHLALAGYDHFVVTVTGNDHNGVSAEAFQRNWPSRPEGVVFEAIDVPNIDDAATDPPKVDRVIAALRRLKTERGAKGLRGTFTYLHLIGPHSPWYNEDPVLDLGTGPADLYDGEIAKVDAHLARLVAALRDLGVLDEMILVILADHGTGLREHGRLGGFLPYEEQIRIPIIMRIPGVAPRTIDDRVASIDLAPTLLGFVAPGRKNPYHGRSLLPLLTGERTSLPPRPTVSFCAFADGYALTDGEGRYKLWHNRGDAYEALFDLWEDPRERRNLVDREPRVADRLRKLLSAFLWQGRRSYAHPYHYRGRGGLD